MPWSEHKRKLPSIEGAPVRSLHVGTPISPIRYEVIQWVKDCLDFTGAIISACLPMNWSGKANAHGTHKSATTCR